MLSFFSFMYVFVSIRFERQLLMNGFFQMLLAVLNSIGIFSIFFSRFIEVANDQKKRVGVKENDCDRGF